MLIPCEDPRAVAEIAFWLAYCASRCVGMGFVQAREGVTREELARDYGRAGSDGSRGRMLGDYVFGRMMKTRIDWDETGVIVDDHPPTPDYQSYSSTYPTYQKLVAAAVEAVAKEGVS